MTPGGWLVMLTSVTAVTALLVWCVVKVLTPPSQPENTTPLTDERHRKSKKP